MKEVKVKMAFLLFAMLSFPALSEEPWHMISFGPDGLGWSGTSEDIDTRSSSTFSEVKYLLNDLSLNYAYRPNDRLQIGGFYKGTHSEYDFRKKDGGTSSTSIEENQIGLLLLYNFQEDLNDAWYAGYSYSITSYEEENSKDLQTEEEKAPFELDDLTKTHEFIVGKRFSLRGFKVENLSYSPQIRFLFRTHGKDFDDQDVGNGAGVNIQPLRFDLLF
jgi:Autotransporter beta-domain